MLLKARKKSESGAAESTVELSAQLRQTRNRSEFFSLATRALLQIVKEFTLDLREIDSDEFKRELLELAERLTALEKLNQLQQVFEKSKKRCVRYADQQKNYLLEREKEFKDIIDIMTKAFITLDSENGGYNRKILRQSEKLEQITLLDDIKKIKQALIYEIEQLRETVYVKEGSDNEQLESLAKQVEILNTELKKVQRESERDGLTGAYNRMAFDRHIVNLVEENTLSKTPFSLLLLDIDDFKLINDTYGHQTGDRVLVALVNKCRQFVRSEDTVARYGGEEFALILPSASLKNAVKKGKQLCQTVATTRYAVEGNSEHNSLGMTISVGVAAFKKGDTAKSIVARADEALYLAKRTGKNRVVSQKQLSKQ
jgi:diguanylate cyclase